MSNNARIEQDTTWLSIKNIQANDSEGNPIDFDTTYVTMIPLVTDIETPINNNIPDEYALYSNYPNPFNPETKIQYDLPKPSHVKLEIFNMLGQRIRILVDDQKPAGFFTVTWDGKDDYGREVFSGLYIYRMHTGSFVSSKKMLLIR